MRARLIHFWYQANSSFWFVPVVLIVASLAMAVLSLALDALTGDWIAAHVVYIELHPGGARQVLSTIAGAMMTTASLVFSLTLVVLSLAAQSLGPRIIDQFMQDRLNQVVLGVFVGTFCFALLVSLGVQEGSEGGRVPLLSVLLAGVGTILSLVLLILYVHHISRSIQSDEVIARLNERLAERMEAYFPTDAHPAIAPASVVEPPGSPFPIPAKVSGYVQTIATDTLIEKAAECGALVRLHARQGDFVIEGLPLLTFWAGEAPDEETRDALMGALILGPKRTDVQDIDLALRNIAEIGVRALSPGINDPYTAIAAIDHLAEAMATLMRREMPGPVLHDADARPRVVRPEVGFIDLLDTAFGGLLQAARDNPTVLSVMTDRLTSLAECVRDDGHATALAAFADRIDAVVRAGGPPKEAHGRIEAGVAKLRGAIREAPA